MSELLVVGHDDVKRLLPMEECIELMASVLADLARGAVWQPLRFVVRPPDEPSLMGLMPAHRSEPTASYGLKAVCIFPSNAARGIDLHQGGVLLFDGETGVLRALVDASAITATRTAAVSGVATRTLAREDARELAILGSGVQARSHLEAMAAARPFERARVWSRTAEHAAAFAAEAEMSFPVEAVGSAEEAVRAADVVVTATSSPEPIVRRDWLAPGAHVNAVGSSIPTARELDADTVAASALFADARESMVNEGGDYLFAVREAGIGPDHIRAELGEVLTGSGQGRLADNELTVFKSLGLAVEDLAAAEHVYARARAAGAGVSVPF
ncbi:MAG: ornithine cyclodeaminase family protein [Gaiellaceae bacterium]|jgi:ornithine cyclodeaminase/alanine dehydrogenase-like protein (mu-crystallin family)